MMMVANNGGDILCVSLLFLCQGTTFQHRRWTHNITFIWENIFRKINFHYFHINWQFISTTKITHADVIHTSHSLSKRLICIISQWSWVGSELICDVKRRKYRRCFVICYSIYSNGVVSSFFFLYVCINIDLFANTANMKSTVVLMVLGTSLLFIGNSVNAWGGIYNNRFSPEMLQNMGYGAPHRIYQEVGHWSTVNFYSYSYNLLHHTIDIWIRVYKFKKKAT